MHTFKGMHFLVDFIQNNRNPQKCYYLPYQAIMHSSIVNGIFGGFVMNMVKYSGSTYVTNIEKKIKNK